MTSCQFAVVVISEKWVCRGWEGWCCSANMSGGEFKVRSPAGHRPCIDEIQLPARRFEEPTFPGLWLEVDRISNDKLQRHHRVFMDSLESAPVPLRSRPLLASVR